MIKIGASTSALADMFARQNQQIEQSPVNSATSQEHKIAWSSRLNREIRSRWHDDELDESTAHPALREEAQGWSDWWRGICVARP